MAYYRCGGIPSELLTQKIISEASGVVAEFDTDIPNTDIYSAIANIDITQKGEGVPTPSNVREFVGFDSMNVTQATKNLFNGVSVIWDGYIASNNQRLRSSDSAKTIMIRCKPNTTYTVSKTAGERFFIAYTERYPEFELTGLCKGIINDNTASKLTITTGANAIYLLAYVYSGLYDSGTAAEMIASVQIEEGSIATTKETVTNYAYSLGSTIYCGNLDVLTGLFTITHGITIYDGSVDEEWEYQSGISGFRINNTEFSGNFVDGASNLFPIRTDSETWTDYTSIRYGFGGANASRLSVYKATTFISGVTSDVSTLRTFLGSNNLVCVYRLATPTTIQLTGHQLTATATTKIYADTGNSTVEFIETLGNKLA